MGKLFLSFLSLLYIKGLSDPFVVVDLLPTAHFKRVSSTEQSTQVQKVSPLYQTLLYIVSTHSFNPHAKYIPNGFSQMSTL